MDFKFGVTPPKDWFEEIWRIREEEVYPAFFGTMPETVIPVTIETLRAIIGHEKEIDPSWLHYAVIEVEPNEKHADWIYVTSALSQPWKAEKEADLNQSAVSGLGYEMMLRTPERAGWAVDVLHRLGAYQIGVYAELMGGKLFKWHDWMPLNGPISPDYPATPVRGMFITHPRDVADHFELASGQVKLLQIVGITGPELAYGIFKGFDLLENLLYETGAAPTTNPDRGTVELPQDYPLPPKLAARF